MILFIQIKVVHLYYNLKTELKIKTMWTIRYTVDGKNMESFNSDVEGTILDAIEDFWSKGLQIHWITTISNENR